MPQFVELQCIKEGRLIQTTVNTAHVSHFLEIVQNGTTEVLLSDGTRLITQSPYAELLNTIRKLEA